MGNFIPLLQEYCYEDYSLLVKLLDEGLVDEDAQRIREELFEPANKDALVQALLRPAPEIVTSSGAESVDTSADETEDEADGT